MEIIINATTKDADKAIKLIDKITEKEKERNDYNYTLNIQILEVATYQD